jgi:hypothetical protein
LDLPITIHIGILDQEKSGNLADNHSYWF